MIPIEKLYVATIADDAQALAERYGVGLELDEFTTAANMDGDAFPTWDAVARRRLAGAPRCLLHAPFAELAPAAIDPLIRQVVRRRFEQVDALARGYGLERIVAHAGFIPHIYHGEWFIEQSMAFWCAFLGQADRRCNWLLENVLEDDPALLLAVVRGVGDARLRICLDVGHAFCRSDRPIAEWIDMLGPYIGHVHLHNNRGREDTHSALDDGDLDMADVIGRLLRAAPDATYTLEMNPAETSLRWLLGAGTGAAEVEGSTSHDGSAEAVVPEGMSPEAAPMLSGDVVADVSGDTTADTPDPVLATLRRVFGYDGFRQGQRALVDAQLAGQDALGIMPTGSGKSICFQLPALLLEGVTIVISPLISLMKDQVSALTQLGVRAAYINSSLTPRQTDVALQRAQAGEYRLIYVAPERLLTPRFLAFAQQAHIALVAVDEAHCISQWGQDFRPTYLDIPRFVAALGRRPAVSAFTATATPQVRADILGLLRLHTPQVVQTGFDRPNLQYEVWRVKHREKDAALLRLVRAHEGMSGIVYCATRDAVESACELLRRHGHAATRYHAGLEPQERRRNQEDFSFDRSQIIVATNAFGMGIDKSNVRFIVHYHMPKDLESYYQEAGRAGRDGETARCVLLYSPNDAQIQRRILEMDDGEAADPALREQARRKARQRLQDMVQYATAQTCLRRRILTYFGEDAPEQCGNCGNCRAPVKAKDMTEPATAILSAVRDTGQRFGLGTMLEMLRGANNQRMRKFSLTQEAAYGTLSGVPEARLKLIAEQLLAEQYLTVGQGKTPIVALGPRAREVLEDGERVWMRLAQPVEDALGQTGVDQSGMAQPSATRTRVAGGTAYRGTRAGTGTSMTPGTPLNAGDLPGWEPPSGQWDAAELQPPDPQDDPFAPVVGRDPRFDGQLFELLRGVRHRLATQLGKPAYIVFSDATLRDMAIRRPHTRTEMLEVKGVGENKMDRFGEDFLEAIRRYER